MAVGGEMFAIVEIMGHVTIAGRVSEQTFAGVALLRIDVPAVANREAYTKFYGPTIIYSITPCDETTALRAAENLNMRPVELYIVRAPSLPATVQPDDYDDDNENEADDDDGF